MGRTVRATVRRVGVGLAGALIITACRVDVGPGAAGPLPPPSNAPSTQPTPALVKQPTPSPSPPHVALSQRTVPTVHGTPLRIPEHTDVERQVTLKSGQQVPLREALKNLDPNEKRRLKNGKEVTLQQVIDAFEALEKHGNVRLKESFRPIALPARTKAKTDETHAALEREREQRRRLEAAGWHDLIERAAGSGRLFRPRERREAQEAAAHPQQPHAGRNAPLPQPKSEPLDLVWHQQWGDPASAGAEVDVSAGNDATYTGTDPTADCAAELKADALLFDHSFEVLRSHASVGAWTGASKSGSQSIQGAGNLAVYVVGDRKPVWQKSGSFVFPKTEEPFNTPNSTIKVPVAGPLALTLNAAGTGAVGVEASIAGDATPGKPVSCKAMVRPYLTSTLTGGATLALAGLEAELMDALVGSVTAGINAQVTLLNAQVPSNLTLAINLDPTTHLARSLDQTSDVEFIANMLSGQLVGWLKIDLDFWAEPILWIFDLDNGTYQTTLWDWQGENFDTHLVGPTKNTIPFGR